MKDTHKRSIAKMLSWRVVATLTTMIVVYVFTGEFLLTAGIGIVAAASKMLLYYGHERAWERLKWGKSKS